jgi:hypothetical protein
MQISRKVFLKSSLLLGVIMLSLPVLAFANSGKVASSPVSAGGVTPYVIDGDNQGGNRTCAEVGYAFYSDSNYFEFSSARTNYNSGSFDASFPSGLSVNTNGTNVSFTSTFPIGAVIVKGSNDANVYAYNPQVKSDSGLASPVNASGNPAGLSNLTFCWNKEKKTPRYTFKFVKAWKGDSVNLDNVKVTFKVGNLTWVLGQDGPVEVVPGTTLQPITEEVTGLPNNCTYKSDVPSSYTVFKNYLNGTAPRSLLIDEAAENGAVASDKLEELVVTNTVTCKKESTNGDGQVLSGSTPVNQVTVTPVGGADAGGAGYVAALGLFGSSITAALGYVLRRKFTI